MAVIDDPPPPTHTHLILFIHQDTEDLCTVSLLDAGPPSGVEHIVVLWAVLVVLHCLLRVTEKRVGQIWERT